MLLHELRGAPDRLPDRVALHVLVEHHELAVLIDHVGVFQNHAGDRRRRLVHEDQIPRDRPVGRDDLPARVAVVVTAVQVAGQGVQLARVACLVLLQQIAAHLLQRVEHVRLLQDVLALALQIDDELVGAGEAFVDGPRRHVVVRVLPQQRGAGFLLADRDRDGGPHAEDDRNRRGGHDDPAADPTRGRVAHLVERKIHPARDEMLGVLRHREEGQQHRHGVRDAENVGERPETAVVGEFLDQRNRGDRQHEDAARVADDAGHAGQEQVAQAGEGGLLLILGHFQFLEIALDHLHRVTDRAGGNQQRNDQNQRIEVEPPEPDPAHAPDGLDGGADHRHQHAVQPAEIDDERQDHAGAGEAEDQKQFVGVVPDPAFQGRLTGHVHLRVVVLYLGADAGDLALDFPIVEPVFVEPGQHQRGLAVLRDVFVHHDVVVEHLEFERAQLHRVVRDVHGQHRIGADHAAGQRLDVADLDVGQRGDLVVVHPGDRVELVGQIADLFQIRFGEDVTFFDLQDRGDDVGAAEGRAVVVVRLNVGMSLRQQVGELAVHLDVARLVAPEGRRDRQQHEVGEAVPPQDTEIDGDHSIGEGLGVTWGSMGHAEFLLGGSRRAGMSDERTCGAKRSGTGGRGATVVPRGARPTLQGRVRLVERPLVRRGPTVAAVGRNQDGAFSAGGDAELSIRGKRSRPNPGQDALTHVVVESPRLPGGRCQRPQHAGREIGTRAVGRRGHRQQGIEAAARNVGPRLAGVIGLQQRTALAGHVTFVGVSEIHIDEEQVFEIERRHALAERLFLGEFRTGVLGQVVHVALPFPRHAAVARAQDQAELAGRPPVGVGGERHAVQRHVARIHARQPRLGIRGRVGGGEIFETQVAPQRQVLPGLAAVLRADDRADRADRPQVACVAAPADREIVRLRDLPVLKRQFDRDLPPSLAAVRGLEDQPVLADGHAVLRAGEIDFVDGALHAGFEHREVLSAIRDVENEPAAAGHPGVVFVEHEGVVDVFPVGEDVAAGFTHLVEFVQHLFGGGLHTVHRVAEEEPGERSEGALARISGTGRQAQQAGRGNPQRHAPPRRMLWFLQDALSLVGTGTAGTASF